MVVRFGKVKLVKQYFGEAVKKEGFSYEGEKAGEYIFSREKDGILQQIKISKDSRLEQRLELLFATGRTGWKIRGLGDFIKEYKKKRYWYYETAEEFAGLMQEFAELVHQYGLAILEQMSVPKPKSKEIVMIKATPEMGERLYESYDRILAEADKKYEVTLKGIEGIQSIEGLIYEKKDKPYEEAKDFLVEMAVLYVAIYRYEPGWEAEFADKEGTLRIAFPGYEYHLRPLDPVVDLWAGFHSGSCSLEEGTGLEGQFLSYLQDKNIWLPTVEMDAKLYASFDGIIKKAPLKYGFEPMGLKGLRSIIGLLYENRKNGFEEVSDLLVEMSALYGEVYRKKLQGDLQLAEGRCVLANVGKYKDRIWILDDIVRIWGWFHDGFLSIDDDVDIIWIYLMHSRYDA